MLRLTAQVSVVVVLGVGVGGGGEMLRTQEGLSMFAVYWHEGNNEEAPHLAGSFSSSVAGCRIHSAHAFGLGRFFNISRLTTLC